jgi:hypothetical protein
MRHPDDEERDRRSHAEERRRQFEASRGLDDARERTRELELDDDSDEEPEPPPAEEQPKP